MPRRGENIYKRKDGRWEARYPAFYDDAGRRHYKSLYAKSYAEVKQKKKEAVLACSAAKENQMEIQKNKQSGENCCLEEACRQWLQSIQPKVKESTYVKYRGILETYAVPALGARPLEKISAEVWESYFAGLLDHGKADGTGLAAKSVSDIKSIIKMVLVFAVRRGWVQNCSLDHIAVRQEAGQIRVLTREEQTDLENYLLADFTNVHMGIYISLYTGMRLGELCALRWSSIDMEKKIISVEKTMMRLKDYSPWPEKKTKIIETVPKSACSVRTIPIPDFLLHKLLKKSAGVHRQAYLLTGKTDKYMEPRLLEYHFQKAAEASRIAHASFHCLRHTFATRCVEVGFDVKTLSVILGHATIHITMNRYVHPTMEMKRSNMQKLGRLADRNAGGQK